MAQLLVTLPDNQVAFFKKVVAQMGFEAEKPVGPKKVTSKKEVEDDFKLEYNPDKAKKIRSFLAEREGLKPVARDVLEAMAEVMEGKTTPWEEGMAEFKKEHEAYWAEQDRIASQMQAKPKKKAKSSVRSSQKV